MKKLKNILKASVFFFALITMLVACDFIKNQNKQDIINSNMRNYQAMESDIINMLVVGTQDEVVIRATIEGKFIVYYYNNNGLIARVPINKSN